MLVAQKPNYAFLLFYTSSRLALRNRNVPLSPQSSSPMIASGSFFKNGEEKVLLTMNTSEVLSFNYGAVVKVKDIVNEALDNWG